MGTSAEPRMAAAVVLLLTLGAVRSLPQPQGYWWMGNSGSFGDVADAEDYIDEGVDYDNNSNGNGGYASAGYGPPARPPVTSSEEPVRAVNGDPAGDVSSLGQLSNDINERNTNFAEFLPATECAIGWKCVNELFWTVWTMPSAASTDAQMCAWAEAPSQATLDHRIIPDQPQHWARLLLLHHNQCSNCSSCSLQTARPVLRGTSCSLTRWRQAMERARRWAATQQPVFQWGQLKTLEVLVHHLPQQPLNCSSSNHNNNPNNNNNNNHNNNNNNNSQHQWLSPAPVVPVP